MKTILLLSMLFCAIAMPLHAELSESDLNQIRLIIVDSEKRVKEEVKKEIAVTNTKIDGLDARLRNVETDIAELRGRRIALSAIKDWVVAGCAVVAIIISIFALRKAEPKSPQNVQDTPKAVSQ